MSPRVHRTLAGSLATLVLGAASGTAAHAEASPSSPPDDTAAAAKTERPRENSVFASGSVSFVDLRGEDRTWSLAAVGGSIKTTEAGVTIAEVQRTARPGLANYRGSVRHEEQITKDTRVYARVAASTGDPLREDWGVGAGITQRVSKSFQLTLDGHMSRYSARVPAGTPKPRFTGIGISPGVIITPKGTPLEIDAQAIVLRNDRKEWQLGGAVRATFYTGDRDLLFAGLSRYPENELGVVRQSTSFYAGLRRELGQGIGLRVTAEHTRLQNTWTARTISVGLEKRF